jgi:hypothetical protein
MDDITPQVTRQVLPGGIYEVQFHGTTRQSVEEFFQHLTDIFEEAIAQNAFPVRTLIVTPPSGVLPLVSVTSGMKQFNPKYGSYPARCVILYEGPMGTMLDVLMRTLARGASLVRVFKHRNRQVAIDWLLADVADSAQQSD